MSLLPYTEAGIIIQLHIIGALLSVTLGPIAIYRRKRDRTHKVVGYIWVVSMATVALSSFGITSFGVVGPFSPIHLLSILALGTLYYAMRAIFRGDVLAHKAALKSLYWNGLLIAGLFNFLPDRATARVIFGENDELGLYVLAAGATFLIARALVLRKKNQRFA